MRFTLLNDPAAQSASLRQTEHRPWPLPQGGWLMGQSWHHLLFLHWSLPAIDLAGHITHPLRLDTYDGKAWIGLTPFQLSGLRLRGTLPPPFVSSFPEVNVRTYVTYGGKPGILFFSLDTSSLLTVIGARRAYRLPYHTARISLKRQGAKRLFEHARAGRRETAARLTYGAAGGHFEAVAAGSLEHFLTERYCLYTADETGLYRAQIHHAPWKVQPAQYAIDYNTLVPFVDDPLTPEHALLADSQHVIVWPLERVRQSAASGEPGWAKNLAFAPLDVAADAGALLRSGRRALQHPIQRSP